MVLEYLRGNNLGDALNAYIFDYYLPDFFDEEKDIIFLGIGSLLGKKKPAPNQKMIVFSTGYAAGDEHTYGSKPQITSDYTILCVRGPLTAELLGIPQSKAVADGALLIKDTPLLNNLPAKKKNRTGFIPHEGSTCFYNNWPVFCKQLGFHYIDICGNVKDVINEIASCERVVTEALHGAIVCDVLRIPFLPVKFYPTINEFKWKDYFSSMLLQYLPVRLSSMFSKTFLLQIFYSKVKNHFAAKILAFIYLVFQRITVLPINRLKLKKRFKSGFVLSDESVIEQKHDQLLKILLDFKNSFGK